MVTGSIQLSHFFEVVRAREATGVCMQDVVFIRKQDICLHMFGRSSLLLQWTLTMDTDCRKGVTYVVQQVETT